MDDYLLIKEAGHQHAMTADKSTALLTVQSGDKIVQCTVDAGQD
jgi:hypothetical protein